MKMSFFAGMAAAAMLALGDVMPRSAPHMREIPRQRRKKMERTAVRREMNATGQVRNLKRDTSAFQRVVNALTNHERNLWARAGYPGLRRLDVSGPAEFDRSASTR